MTSISHIEVKCPFKPCTFVGQGITIGDARTVLRNHMDLQHLRTIPGQGQEEKKA